MQAKIIQKPIYKVQKDDTITSICQKCKVSQVELLKLNNISQITPNQILILPKQYSFVYVVQPLDTYESIAQKLNLSVDQIKKATLGKKMFIGQCIYL